MTDGLEYLGFDFGDIAKGAAGVLSGTGNILSGDKRDKGSSKDDVRAAIERQKLEDEKAAAEKKLRTLTTVGVAGAAIIATAYFLKKR